MERASAALDKELQSKRKKYAEEKGGLVLALWNYASNYYRGNTFTAVWEELERIYGKAPSELKSVEEFWVPEVKQAVSGLGGEAFRQDMEEIMRMRMNGQFSSSMWRRSYRSSDFGYHAARAIAELCSGIYLCTYQQNVKELLFCNHSWLRGYENVLALEIRRGNEEIIDLIREAITGEGTEVLFSAKIIRAVIISGNDVLIDLLMKLLLAGRLQEGLRQQILENADAGSTDTLIRILKVCLDEDMFRYSSTIRAFDTWTGLGFGDAKPAAVKKCAALALECLTDEAARKRYLDSENNLEAYFSLWGTACYEVEKTDRMARKLLDDEKKYRRILGWLFVSHTDSARYQMRIAEQYLAERDEETLAWVVSNLAVTRTLVTSYSYGRTRWEIKAVPNSDLPRDAGERRKVFRQLEEVARYIGNKSRSFTGNPFAFTSICLESGRVIDCMMSLAGYDLDQQLIDELMTFLPNMSVEQRRAIYNNFLEPETRSSHRAYLRQALEDRSIHVKDLAIRRLAKCSLLPEDLEALADGLRSKSSSLRKSVLAIFQEQKPEALSPLIGTLLASAEEYQVQAGIELLLAFQEKEPQMLDAMQEKLEELRWRKLSTQTTILLKQLGGKAEPVEADSEENGFGIYAPAVVEAALAEQAEQEGTEASGCLPEEQLRQMIPDGQEYLRLIEQMNRVFERHADYEYETENWDGSRKKVLFGDAATSLLIPAEWGTYAEVRRNRRLEMVPFQNEFVEALGEYGIDTGKMLGLCYMAVRYNADQHWSGLENQSWFTSIAEPWLVSTYHNAAYNKYGSRYWQIMDILALMPQKPDAHEVFCLAMRIYRTVLARIGEENLNRNYVQKKAETGVIYGGNRECYPINHRMLGYWRMLLKQTAKSGEDFKVWFLTEYRLERLVKVSVAHGLTMEDYFRACEEKLIPQDVLTERLMLGAGANGDIRVLTNPNRFQRGREILETYSWAKEYVRRIVQRIVEVEEKRGELTTPLTPVAHAIERFEGAEYFCGLLAALGKENFFRGYTYSSDMTKRAVLSRLLKRCYPAKEDTPEKLAACLKETDIRESRLAEAVMYAPQWAAFAEQILNWKGLKCAVWFFHAHINETFSAEKETEVALYSPITPQQFNDGAFDREWFFEAYETLGEKRFRILYKSAKYITSGNAHHRRSQLYADAVLGRLDAQELKQEIIEKRNQEKLRCYPLIPIPEGKTDEALRRYEFIQTFLKESRQFGAQRRESEHKACQTALENLAITTGFSDVNRMTWYLESEKMEEIRPLLEKKELEGVELWLEIGPDGTAELAVERKGKRQKTLPKALNKDSYVLTLKEKVKELKEQKRRGKESLERAMTDGTEFGAAELRKISQNPILAPMLFNLVWNDGKQNGLLQGAGETLCLQPLGGPDAALSADASLRIAHPHDLMLAGEWADYMHLLYERKTVQPFKQVFREYYPLTEDERHEKNLSRRYAGYQVQPQKTVALLRGRGWTVDYEEGLQKVYYRENLIVRMYALADWFSPAEIEAPTLEVIRFFDRKTGEPVDLEKVPPILFSEAMRDMDLVVSVAYVGGVDPEASHSTVEMRTAIAQELVKLLKLNNVEFIGAHAKVHGVLGNYSVHLGSGIVHAESVGMLAILPVHSQARGRIFLPFADDDPKTAEIMSKILLLAEDRKLKDPSILNQLQV